MFLFVGPSGVGKTELAKALAAQLFGECSRKSLFVLVFICQGTAVKHASCILLGSELRLDVDTRCQVTGLTCLE